MPRKKREIQLTEEQRKWAAATLASSTNEGIRSLSPQQLQIARSAADGNTALETAKAFNLTEGAVSSCRIEIFKKLNIEKVEELCLLLDGPVPEGSVFEPLAARETELVMLLFKAKTPEQIAVAMDISIFTVRDHIANIKSKMHFQPDGRSNIPKLLKVLRHVMVVNPEAPTQGM